jgi:tetraacyldisaccharide 4'-kinase
MRWRPLEWAYRGTVAARNTAYEHGLLEAHAVGVPVISVGNLSVGGSGKTPVSGWLISELQRRGRRPALLHGAYAPDEPELHRRWAPGVPVLENRDRLAAAARAVAGGADVLVLDDAFQHRRIARDLDLLLVPCESWGGRIRLLPRGGWREPPGSARRASLIAVTAAARGRVGRARRGRAGLARARRRRSGCTSGPPAGGKRHRATPGNRRWQWPRWRIRSFLDNARSAGAVLHDQRWWRDHHRYHAADAALILARAGTAPIVTTEKDWVKLERLLPADRVWVLRQEVAVESGHAELAAALERVLQR